MTITLEAISFKKAVNFVTNGVVELEGQSDILSNILFEVDNGVARLVCANAHSIALCDIGGEDCTMKKRFLISKKALLEYVRTIKNGSISLQYSDRGVTLSNNQIEKKFDIVDYEFPDYTIYMKEAKEEAVAHIGLNANYISKSLSALDDIPHNGVIKMDFHGTKGIIRISPKLINSSYPKIQNIEFWLMPYKL